MSYSGSDYAVARLVLRFTEKLDYITKTIFEPNVCTLTPECGEPVSFVNIDRSHVTKSLWPVESSFVCSRVQSANKSLCVILPPMKLPVSVQVLHGRTTLSSVSIETLLPDFPLP